MKRYNWLERLTVVAVLAASLSSYGVTLLDGKGIRLAFDAEDKGYNCLSIENRVNPKPVSFGGEISGKAAFWSLTFWKDGTPTNSLTIDNLAPCVKSMQKRTDELVFDWSGLSLGDEQGVVDVRATVRLTQNETAAEWRLAVKNRSARWGLAETAYPVIRNIVRSGEADVLLPRGNLGGRLVKSYKEGAALCYPRVWGTQVQTCAFMLGKSGLQITTLDGKCQEKVLDMTGVDFALRYRCPNEGVSGAANAPDFAVETAVFSGDWWRAAKRYRAWATRQKWVAKGPLATRKDFNRQLGDVGYWMRNNMVEPSLISNMMVRAMAALPGVPLGLHWYVWHKCPFDHYYPDIFPARPGVKETVEWLKDNGVLVMPYINGRLWDNGIASFTNAIPYACKKPDGTCYEEEYGSGRKFAPMCPTVKPWQNTMDALCDRLENELGVNAVYLDQISSSRPAPCHDRSHGHSLGGGEYWTDAYRELMAPIRAKAVRRGVALTSENAAEPYMDSFDAHLTWFGRASDEVPLLPAVYSGYAVYFGSVEDDGGKDTIDAFCARQGQDFLWGVQLGWNVRWILDEAHREYLAFVARLCRERVVHKEFFVYGELLGDLPISSDVPTAEVAFERYGYLGDKGPFHVPVVSGMVWCDPAGNRRAFIVNVSGNSQTFTYDYGANHKTVTLPPRSVVSEVLR